MFKILFLLFLAGVQPISGPVPNSDLVCGKWVSTDKNLIVKVYKEGGEFKAKLIWFLNDDKIKPMDEWTDKHNPDPTLRQRKLIGMDILKNLDYEPKSNSWENGKIYDAKGGRYWDASAHIEKDGQLKVNGYWHFKFIGKTMTFNRVVE